MRYAIPLGILCVFMWIIGAVTGMKNSAAGDRADRLERIEATLSDVLERVKRIEGFVGKPTPAPALDERGPLDVYREQYKRNVSPSQWERISPLLEPKPKFDPTAPLPVNPKTGRSALVEAMEQAARDYDEADVSP